MEDYLEAIHVLSKDGAIVRSKDIAQTLSVSAASVTGMCRKLADKNLVNYTKHAPLTLTADGHHIAKSVKGRHDTLAAFLQSIGVPHDIADQDACRIEHELSPPSLTAIKRFVAEERP